MCAANIGLSFVGRYWWVNALCAALMFGLACWNIHHARRITVLADDFGVFAAELRWLSPARDELD